MLGYIVYFLAILKMGMAFLFSVLFFLSFLLYANTEGGEKNMNVLTRKYKKWLLGLAKKEINELKSKAYVELPTEDDTFCKLYQRCDDYWDDERFGKLAKQTLIRSLSSKRKN